MQSFKEEIEEDNFKRWRKNQRGQRGNQQKVEYPGQE